MIALKKALEVAKSSGIDSLMMFSSVKAELSVSYLDGVLDCLESSSDSSFLARGGMDGKSVNFYSDILDKSSLELMIKSMKEQQVYSKPYDNDLLVRPIEGKLKGFPVNSKKNYNVNSKELSDLAKEIYDKIRAADDAIYSTNVNVIVQTAADECLNSNGVHYKYKSSAAIVTAQVLAKKGELYVEDYKFKLYKDITKVEVDKFVKEICKSTLDKLKAKNGVAGEFASIFDPSTALTLLSPVLSHLSMFSIDQNLSLLKDTLDKKVFSDVLTIHETPHDKTPTSVPFDSEGYPTKEKVLIENGVVKTYLYDQEMAKKYNHEPTGNGFGSLTIHPGLTKITIKKGSRKFKELVKDVKEGYYITDLSGVHSGLDALTGNFTLSAEGYYIKDGKMKSYVNQFTVSGNIMNLLNEIKEMSSDTKTSLGGDVSPYMLVNKLIISC